MNKSASLTPKEKVIIQQKGTEAPGTGKFDQSDIAGTYLCRQCGLALFRAQAKFISMCGWPSFDDQISDNVKQLPDADGRRTEILCNRCYGHLGHIFHGENYTARNTRYCVNSASIDFVQSESVLDTGEGIFAAGCFWGVEALMKKLDGVLFTQVGYTGGDTDSPSYEQVCNNNTGHYEAIRVIYDIGKINYEDICKLFFEIHDPTQSNGQGPDIGQQYQSAIFYYDNEQKLISDKLIDFLKSTGLAVSTNLLPVSTFWPAEEYHQDYYQKNGQAPYCHIRTKRF